MTKEMKILVANLGSTSFKYRLFDMTTEKVLARGGVERIGAAKSRSYAQTDRGSREVETDAGGVTPSRSDSLVRLSRTTPETASVRTRAR